MPIYEYTNDLSCRIIIQEKLDGGFLPDEGSLKTLQQLDRRLRAILLPTTQSLHGNFPAHYFWFHGVPRNAEEVVQDAQSLGILT